MRLFAALFLLALLTACHRQDAPAYRYFRITQIGDAETVTAYNKGFAAGTMLLLDGGSDSFLFYRAGQGSWKALVSDSLRHWVNAGFAALRQRSAGFLFDTAFSGNAYDGPEYLVEWAEGDKAVVQCVNDSRSTPFCRFLDSAERYAELRAYPRRALPAFPLDPDTQAVRALRYLGVYDQKPMPYIPAPCVQGWDSALLYGSWRKQEWPRRDSGSYTIWTLHPDGTSTSQNFREGKPGYAGQPPFRFSARDSILGFGPNGEQRFKVLTLTRNCLVLRELREPEPDDPRSPAVYHFDRVRR